LEMVDKSVNLLRTYFKLFFSPLDSPDRPSHPGVRPIRLLRRHVHRPLQHMRRQLHLTFMALKRKPAARGKRAPHAPSIVGWFCQLPLQASAAGSVAPNVCPFVLVAARGALAALHADAQNDSRSATTRDGRAGVGPVGKSPRCVVQGLPPHGGPSDSLAQ
jgi:hypothetical protein